MDFSQVQSIAKAGFVALRAPQIQLLEKIRKTLRSAEVKGFG
ncbi:MAG TPA: hypothetical protein V6C84_20975 [Coleofasciculaceae cyanobacterium]|jgi:hypothetical protein